MITPLSFYNGDVHLFRELRATLSIPNLAVFLIDYEASDTFDMRDKVSDVGTRSLIICGECDQLTPPNWNHYLNARIPCSTAFFIRDAGQMVPFEKPNA